MLRWCVDREGERPENKLFIFYVINRCASDRNDSPIDAVCCRLRMDLRLLEVRPNIQERELWQSTIISDLRKGKEKKSKCIN